MNSIKSTTIYITNLCNSCCITCNMWKQRISQDTPFSEWEPVLIDIGKLGIDYICFSGGEPLLRQDITKFVLLAKRAGVSKIEIATNGLLLNSDRLNELAALGISGLHLSIDGIGDVHDNIRGVKGSFQKSLNSLVQAHRLGLRVSLNMNLLASNLQDVQDVIDLARIHGATWLPNMINNTQHAFKGVNISALLPDKDAADALVRLLEQEMKRSDTPVGIRSYHLPLLTHLLTGGKPPEKPCHFGSNTIYIYPDLSVSPGCNVLKPVSSLCEKSLKEIVTSTEYKNRIKDMEHHNCPGCTCSVWSTTRM